MKINTYYEEMTETCKAWQAAKDERKARKQEIINTLGWDSEELKAWYAEDEAAKFPYTSGEMKAYWAFKNSLELEELEMNDSCWDNEWHDFIATLRKMGITHFTTTTQSTGLMNDLYGYVNEGCTMLGLHAISKKSNRWGTDEVENVRGILFQIDN